MKIIEQNPQPAPQVIPGYRSQVRFNPSGRTVCIFQAMAIVRTIPITSGEVIIVDEGRPEAAASTFDLAAPAKRSMHEAGANSSRLQIINTCPFKHTVRTPANALNGRASTITFEGVGAIELYAHGGVWIVLSVSGAKIT